MMFFCLKSVGQYKTSVTEADSNEIPKIGSNKRLECVVEDEGKPSEDTTVRWLHNGLPIRGSARYSGELTRVRHTGNFQSIVACHPYKGSSLHKWSSHDANEASNLSDPVTQYLHTVS